MMNEEMKKAPMTAEDDEHSTDKPCDEDNTSDHVNNFLDIFMPKSFISMPNYEELRANIIPQLYKSTMLYIGQILSSRRTQRTQTLDIIYNTNIREKVDVGLETDLCILRRKIYKNWKRLQTYGKLYRKYGGIITINEDQFNETDGVIPGASLQNTNKNIPNRISGKDEDGHNSENILQFKVDKSKLTKSDTVNMGLKSTSKININMNNLSENKSTEDLCHQYNCHTSGSDELLFFKLNNNEDDNICKLLEKESSIQKSQSDILRGSVITSKYHRIDNKNDHPKIICVRKKCVKSLKYLDTELFKEKSRTSFANNVKINASSGSSYKKQAPITTEYLHKHCRPNSFSDSLCISFGNECLKPNNEKEIEIKDELLSFKSVQSEMELNKSSSSSTRITIMRNPRDLTTIKHNFQLYHNYEKTLKKYRFHKKILHQARSLCNLRVSLTNLKEKQKLNEQNKLKESSIRHRRFLYNFSKKQNQSSSEELDITKHLQGILKYVTECSQTCDINIVVNVNVNSNNEKTWEDDKKFKNNYALSQDHCTSTSTEQVIKVMVYPTKTGISGDGNRILIPIKESLNKSSNENSSVACLLPVVVSSKKDISCEKIVNNGENKIMIKKDILILKPIQVENEYLEPINTPYLQPVQEKTEVPFKECEPIKQMIKSDQCDISKEVKIEVESYLPIQEPPTVTDAKTTRVEIKQDSLHLKCIERDGIKFENYYYNSPDGVLRPIHPLQPEREKKEVHFKEFEPFFEPIKGIVKSVQSLNVNEVKIDLEPCLPIHAPPTSPDAKAVKVEIEQDRLYLESIEGKGTNVENAYPYYNSSDKVSAPIDAPLLQSEKEKKEAQFKEHEPLFKTIKEIIISDHSDKSEHVKIDIEPYLPIQGSSIITGKKDINDEIEQESLQVKFTRQAEFNFENALPYSPDELLDINKLLNQACKKRNLLLRYSVSEPFRYKLTKQIGLPDFGSRSSAINSKVTCIQQYNMEISSIDVMNFRSSSFPSFESEMLIKVTDMASTAGLVRQAKNNIIVNSAETAMDQPFSSFDFSLEPKASKRRQKLVAFVCDVFNKKHDVGIQRSMISARETFSYFNPWRRGNDAVTCILQDEVPCESVACSTTQSIERKTTFQKFTTYTTNYLRTYFFRNQSIPPLLLESVNSENVKEEDRAKKSQNFWKIALITTSVTFAATVCLMFYLLHFKSSSYKRSNIGSTTERDLVYLSQLGF